MRIVVPTPYPVGAVNAYLVKGPPVTLVDVGPAGRRSQAALERGLAGQGLGLGDVERVVLTHTHPDHAGLAGHLAGSFGTRVYVHPADAHRLEPGGLALGPRRPLLARAGVPEPHLAALERQAGRNQELVVPVPQPLFLRAGQGLDFDGFSLEVLHTPGHSPGHLCLVGGPGRPELLCGDCLLPRLSPNPVLEPAPGAPGRFPSLERYLESLDALGGLEVAQAHPGHGEPFTDHRGFITRIRGHHERRKKRVEAAVGREPRTAWEVAGRLFPRVKDWEVFLAVSEAVAHLGLLVGEGRLVEEEGGDGVARYRRPATGAG